MEDTFNSSLFLDTDYQISEFKYKDCVQKVYSLHSSSTDYDLTGQIIWRAAQQLAQYIVNHQQDFVDQIVLELGAGAGLSGLVCANYAKKVYVTDGNETIYDLMLKNKDLATNKNVEMNLYLWGKQGDSKFLSDQTDLNIDIIIGADILYWPQSLIPLVQTLDTYIQRNENVKIYTATRIRSELIEQQFDQKLKLIGLQRIQLFNQGMNMFYKIEKIKTETTEEK